MAVLMLMKACMMAELLKVVQQGVNNRVSDSHSSSIEVLQREIKICSNICQKKQNLPVLCLICDQLNNYTNWTDKK